MLALLVANALAADPDCLSAFGQTACGYDCEAAYGKVACAQTPEGKCEAAYGDITCWDPPPQAPTMRRPRIDPGFLPPAGRPNDPPATCESAFGMQACGYDCEAAFGVVKCALTPQGVCDSAFGEVTCWDPPYRLAPGAPPATCESAFGKTACGYDCEAAFGEIACASTPQGKCDAAFGKVTCWDPPPPR